MTTKDYIMMVGDQFVKRDFFGTLFLSNSDFNVTGWDSEEDAYIAKNNSAHPEIRAIARVYERTVTINYERCD
ncbi:hypothetical protein JC221_025 [Yersinia phage JC221]|nr:hypothetical protein JC221_025 [Yersinia phage JC221]